MDEPVDGDAGSELLVPLHADRWRLHYLIIDLVGIQTLIANYQSAIASCWHYSYSSPVWVCGYVCVYVCVCMCVTGGGLQKERRGVGFINAPLTIEVNVRICFAIHSIL